MSVCVLPEEMLSKILALVLLIPRDIFFNLRHDATIQDHGRHPYLLLVCKQWLRIGTPLLYESVQLTRTSETQSVAKLVQSHPDVGNAIRTVKLQPSHGGLEEELYQIVRMAPNIENLYFDGLRLQDGNSLSGLRSSMPALKLKRLHVCHLNMNRKAASNEANQLVLGGMKDHWSSLVSVTFSDVGDPFTNDMLDLLVKLPSLEKISVSTDDTYHAVSSGRICRLAECPQLKRIEFRGEYAFRDRSELFQSLNAPKSFIAKFATARNGVDEWQDVILRRKLAFVLASRGQ